MEIALINNSPHTHWKERLCGRVKTPITPFKKHYWESPADFTLVGLARLVAISGVYLEVEIQHGWRVEQLFSDHQPDSITIWLFALLRFVFMEVFQDRTR